MRIPTPSDVVGLAARSAESIGDAATALPRLLALLDSAEALIRRTDAVIDRIEQTQAGADALVARTGAVVDRADALTAAIEPSITRLLPVLDRLAETTDVREVDALVGLVDQLPELTDSLRTDVLPIMKTLGSVGDDVHDLLLISARLSDMLSRLPGMGRVRRKVDEESDDEVVDQFRQRREEG
ncbi:hypothetical protein [Naumannella cuiyingiana]|uniref:Uncharacterized protein n=1 Tax=Naumannella cuiyingiana TaxID=1347891 RepID=A0A7Z0D8Z7_9ACTN|nr:hypothetical protein [Naumannella cuiyingiana]NYI71025.1 hypothetical protein [Naumannella cuiyingiana]